MSPCPVSVPDGCPIAKQGINPNGPCSQWAFTLIELLIVIAIMATLTGLLLAGIPLAQQAARRGKTDIKIQAVLQGLVTSSRSEGRSPATMLQINLGLAGVTRFRTKTSSEAWAELTTAGHNNGRNLDLAVPAEGTWLDPAPLHHFAAPWDQEAGPLATISEPSLDGGGWSTVTYADLSPALSAEFLVESGIVDAADRLAAVRTDRNPAKPWNDAWGNPLVVVYGFYQPVRAEDLREANSLYQHSRAVYVGIGSVGPRISDATVGTDLESGNPAAWAADMDALWQQIATVGRATDWTAAAFAKPAWSGIRRTKGSHLGGTVEVHLSEPLSLR